MQECFNYILLPGTPSFLRLRNFNPSSCDELLARTADDAFLPFLNRALEDSIGPTH